LKPYSFFFLFLFIIESFVYAENSTFYFNKGVESFKTGDFKEAEKNFKQALEINPSYTLGHYGLGRVYIIQNGRAPDAIEHFRRTVSLDPDFAAGWFNLGLAELVSGKHVAALQKKRKDKNFCD